MSDDSEKLSRTERLFARMAVAQTITAVVAVMVSVIALYAALNEADAVRKQQQASVWPDIGLVYENFDLEENRGVARYVMTNDGVGPALLHDIRIFVDGERVGGWNEAVARLTGEPDPFVFSTSFVSRSIRPGHSVRLMDIRDETLIATFNREVERLSLDICFCSIFDECWVEAYGAMADGPVPHCPVDGETN